jgi:uncharacterized protein (TIGR03083 family)
MDGEYLQEEIRTAVSRVADLLRAAPDGDAAVCGLAWSVSELGAHLVSIPRRYQRMLAGGVPFPESMSALNEAELRAVGIAATAELADLLVTETGELVAELGEDGDRAVPFFGMQHTVAGVAGVWLGELLVHGLDLARTLGRPWQIRPDQVTGDTTYGTTENIVGVEDQQIRAYVERDHPLDCAGAMRSG